MKGVTLLLSVTFIFVSIDEQAIYVFSCFATIPSDSQSDTNTAPTETESGPTCGPLPYDKTTVSPDNIDQFLPYDPDDTFPLGFIMSYSVHAVLVLPPDYCEFYTDNTNAAFSSLTGMIERTCELVDGEPVWTVPKTAPLQVVKCISQESTCTTCQPP